MSRRNKQNDWEHYDIPTKANRVLNIVLVAMLLIVIRIWHLAVIQYDSRLDESRKPQRRVVVEPAIRATIRDRFNIPMALNKIQYQAAILYSHIREIPSFVWEKDEAGKKIRKSKRKEYIHTLSQILAEELNLEAEKIEDLIHAKAAYYPQIPFIVKEEISEQEYYRLKILEKDWPGIFARHVAKRVYPKERVASDILGYMGAISRKEHEAILHELKELEHFIAQQELGEEPVLPKGFASSSEVKNRLKDLGERAYTIHDYVGKVGIEGAYEEQLRGYYGKKTFYSDSKGNFLRELPGARSSLSGQRVLLTISSELQEFAEQLLAQNEKLRLVRKTPLEGVKQTIISLKQPWIKGGAIIAMDPSTGEILALASHPRFDPNDFIPSGDLEVNNAKKARINRWFEGEAYLADVWDQQIPFERESYDDHLHQFYDEQRLLTWNNYLDFILPTDSALRKKMSELFTIDQAIELQREIQSLLDLFDQPDLYTIINLVYAHSPDIPYNLKITSAEKQHWIPMMEQQAAVIQNIKHKLTPYFGSLLQNYDKVLLVDLCRLLIDDQLFSANLASKMGYQSLGSYRNASGSLVTLKKIVKEMSRDLFHEIDFKAWRQSEEKPFLKQKREDEKRNKTYAKPYLDYLDQKEKMLFGEFWGDNQWNLLLVFLSGKTNQNTSLNPYQDHFFKLFDEIRQGAHRSVVWQNSYKVLQKIIHGLSTDVAIEYLKTMRSYRELNRPLFGHYRGLKERKAPQEKHLAAAFYPAYGFGYGRSYAYRQAATQGSIFKLVVAYEALVQNYRRLNRRDLTYKDLNPLIIEDVVYKHGDTHYVGYTQDGSAIPQLYKGGRLPRSLAHQHNGEVDLVKAIAVSSNPYFSLLAGDCLDDPEDLAKAACLFSYGRRTGIDLPGEIAGSVPNDLSKNRTGLYALAIGQHSLVVTPLQTAVMMSALANGGKILKPKIVNLLAGRQPKRCSEQIPHSSSFIYRDSLNLVGIDFPLFTAVGSKDQKQLITKFPVEVKSNLFMPEIVHSVIFQGLRQAAIKTHAEGTASLIRLYGQYPETMKTFTELKQDIIGKTSTSESVETIDLDWKEGSNIYTHVWYGGIALEPTKNRFLFKDEFSKPELVVVVYLRYGSFGKEAAPVAAQIVKKWRELKQKYEKSEG